MAAKKLEVYKCELCGNIVTVLHGGEGTLVCCNQPMTLFEENTTDAAQEKHVPVVETAEGKLHVKVGSAAHPMEEKHYIEWIEATAGDKTVIRFLNPGEAPEAAFEIEGTGVNVRAYCNLHGLWRA